LATTVTHPRSGELGSVIDGACGPFDWRTSTNGSTTAVAPAGVLSAQHGRVSRDARNINVEKTAT